MKHRYMLVVATIMGTLALFMVEVSPAGAATKPVPQSGVQPHSTAAQPIFPAYRVPPMPTYNAPLATAQLTKSASGSAGNPVTMPLGRSNVPIADPNPWTPPPPGLLNPPIPTHYNKNWCMPVSVPPVPPSGFSPLTANASQLKLYGFPAKPPTTSPAYSVWLNLVEHMKYRGSDLPDLLPDGSCPPPAPPSAYYTFEQSTNWAGHIVPRSYVNAPNLIAIESSFVVPAVPANSGVPNADFATAPTASFWTGLGISSLLQAGVAAISTVTPQYRFWTEDAPYAAPIYEGPIIVPGQTAVVELAYNGNDTTTYTLLNQSTGAYDTYTNYSPDVGYNAANYIVERRLDWYLPNFDYSNVSGNSFTDSNYTLYWLTTNNNYMTMTLNGTTLSAPSGVDNSTSDFTQYWNAYS